MNIFKQLKKVEKFKMAKIQIFAEKSQKKSKKNIRKKKEVYVSSGYE